jgi:hypothetical protein
MRRFMLTAVATGAALVAGYGSATAQLVIETPSAGVYVGTPNTYDSRYYTDRRAPRVYGYTRGYRYDEDDDAVAIRPNGPGGCGTYYYWNGDRCVDARR